MHLSELICKSTKSTHFRASCNLHVYKSSKGHIIFFWSHVLSQPAVFLKARQEVVFLFWSLQKPWTTLPISKLQRPKIKLSHFNQIYGPPIRSPNVSQRTWKLGLESPPWKLERNKRHNFLIKPQVNQGFLQNKNHLTTPRALIKDQKSH